MLQRIAAGLGLAKWIIRLRSYRPFILTATLVLLIVLSPAGDRYPAVAAALVLPVFAIVLILSSFAADRRLLRYVALPAGLAWALARTFDGIHLFGLSDVRTAPFAGLLLTSALLWAILDHFNRTLRITGAIIAWAFAGYLLIAVAFAQIYIILSDFLPATFTPPLSREEGASLLYFSLATLSSLGYGDIVPHDPFIRLIAALETIVGIFYVAVVVARLVGSASFVRRPPKN